MRKVKYQKETEVEAIGAETTKQLLLSAATKLFAQQGYAGSSVKEIAEQAGVNVSLISYHFNGKEGLYKACLDRFGRENLELAERILRPAENAEEVRVRLQMFVEQMLLTVSPRLETSKVPYLS